MSTEKLYTKEAIQISINLKTKFCFWCLRLIYDIMTMETEILQQRSNSNDYILQHNNYYMTKNVGTEHQWGFCDIILKTKVKCRH